ncbi:MAG: hypothetical protein AAFS10_26540, partial [Myxococcota bacterium]
GFGGASGSTSSSKDVAATDGDPKACETASKQDDKAVAGCQAVMRVSILPLIEGKVAGVTKDKGPKRVDTRTCPEGYVRQDEICVEQKTVETFLCNEDDRNTCKIQCEKGHLGSCGRYATFVNAELPMFVGLKDSDAAKTKQIAAQHSDFVQRFEQACLDELEVPACEAAAWLIEHSDGKSSPKDNAEANRILALITTGCEWGGTDSCTDIIGVYGEGFWSDQGIGTDAEKMVSIAGEGCASGSTRSCFMLGETLYGAFIGDIKSDPKRAASFFAKACYGGDSEGCFWASLAYGSNDGATCSKLVKENISKEELELYLPSLSLPTPNEPKEIATYCNKTRNFYDLDKALGLADKACYIDGGTLSGTTCGISVDLEEMAR